MSDIICVTNRRSCNEDFLCRIEKIAKAHPKAIILREKDLSAQEYKTLAAQVLEICGKYGTQCILHSFIDVAIELGSPAIHLPLPVLRGMSEEQKKHFTVIGASCHSLQDLEEAEALGCTYITAGHIFETDCKAGLPGRGLEFLHSICEKSSIPVYGIGGISHSNIYAVRGAGANGACIMSSIMKCRDVEVFLKRLIL